MLSRMARRVSRRTVFCESTVEAYVAYKAGNTRKLLTAYDPRIDSRQSAPVPYAHLTRPTIHTV